MAVVRNGYSPDIVSRTEYSTNDVGQRYRADVLIRPPRVKKSGAKVKKKKPQQQKLRRFNEDMYRHYKQFEAFDKTISEVFKNL